MEHHQKEDINHAYCSLCDQDFDTEEDLGIHKLESNVHHTCLFCHGEFMDEERRDNHLKFVHPSCQNIRCTGCNGFYRTAASLIRHIEQNRCHKIPVACKYGVSNRKNNDQAPRNGFQNVTFTVTSPESLKPNDLIPTLTVDVPWNKSLGLYICHCGYETSLESPIKRHLMATFHFDEKKCISCDKEFQSTSALVAHLEMAKVRCKIRDTHRFDSFVTKVTKGLIQVQGHLHDGSKRLVALSVEDANVAFYKVSQPPGVPKVSVFW
ncbi:C2H2 finger domain protein [Penicillium sp. IBT 16267x]|nr:C2H2 finger domain protein [Penicillium sp. IBT 16267x]